MNRIGQLLTKHRNAWLLALMLTTLLLGRYFNHQQSSSPSVEIPVIQASALTLDPLALFWQERNQGMLEDIASLEALCAQTTLDERTRDDAAALLTSIIASRRAQDAIEGALSASSLYPCTVVVQDNAVTVVTAKKTITEKDTALVLTLADAHTNVSPENVRILTAE